MKKILILALVMLCITSISAQENAEKLLSEALETAAKQNKHVFIKFSASWCGWCKLMDENMNSKTTKAFFETSYETIELVVLEAKDKKELETPGGMELLKKYNGIKSGLPFWVILNSEGVLVEDSFNANGQNLGCPASKEEVTVFIKKLKQTSTISDVALQIISKTFTRREKQ
ncbi:MAG: thiol-disulfide isomerase/thioredoxin [Patiriisocius sp.]|jgi:thiol-disulfide isomerase/thioredoxin